MVSGVMDSALPVDHRLAFEEWLGQTRAAIAQDPYWSLPASPEERWHQIVVWLYVILREAHVARDAAAAKAATMAESLAGLTSCIAALEARVSAARTEEAPDDAQDAA